MYRLSWLAENLNSTSTLQVQNDANATRNCVHHKYGLSGFVENLNSTDTWVKRIAQIKREIVYIRCTDCLDLQKFKFCRYVEYTIL